MVPQQHTDCHAACFAVKYLLVKVNVDIIVGSKQVVMHI
jgi:hypothetical protein